MMSCWGLATQWNTHSCRRHGLVISMIHSYSEASVVDRLVSGSSTNSLCTKRRPYNTRHHMHSYARYNKLLMHTSLAHVITFPIPVPRPVGYVHAHVRSLSHISGQHASFTRHNPTRLHSWYPPPFGTINALSSP